MGEIRSFPIADLPRQAVQSRMAGYEDLNDAKWISRDPTFTLIVPEKIWERGAGMTSRLLTFETEMPAGSHLTQWLLASTMGQVAGLPIPVG